MKKCFFRILLFIVMYFVLFQNVILANDEDEEFIEFNDIWEEISQTGVSISNEPILNSRHVVVLDRASKTIIFEKSGKTKCAMASTTKIMTAILVLEKGNLDEITDVSRKSSKYRWLKAWIKKRR